MTTIRALLFPLGSLACVFQHGQRLEAILGMTRVRGLWWDGLDVVMCEISIVRCTTAPQNGICTDCPVGLVWFTTEDKEGIL